jgi:hypothetical protein
MDDSSILWSTVEAAAADGNLTVWERETIKDRKTWKLRSNVASRIGVHVSSQTRGSVHSASVNPVITMDAYEAMLPSTFHAESESVAMSEWMPIAIDSCISRADEFLAVLEGIEPCLIGCGFGGSIRQLPPESRGDRLVFTFVAKEEIQTGTGAIVYCISPVESGIVLRTKVCSSSADGSTGILHETEVIRAGTASRILATIPKTLLDARMRYPRPKEPAETPYERLLRDPDAYGGNVSILIIDKDRRRTQAP